MEYSSHTLCLGQEQDISYRLAMRPASADEAETLVVHHCLTNFNIVPIG